MCVSPCVLVAIVTTRTTRSCAPYIGALLASVPASVSHFLSLHETLPVLVFAPLRLCTSAHLRLCASAPLRLCASVLLSSLCADLLVLLCLSSLVLLSLVSGSALPLVSASHPLHSPLFLHSPLPLHSSLLYIRSSYETSIHTCVNVFELYLEYEYR